MASVIKNPCSGFFTDLSESPYNSNNNIKSTIKIKPKINQTQDEFRSIKIYHQQNLALKAHRQISKKRCFENYCSYDQVCQFSASQGTPRRSYIENLTNDGKFINKRVRLFIHQTMCPEEKNISMSQQGFEMAVKQYFKKNKEAATGGAEAVTGSVL